MSITRHVRVVSSRNARLRTTGHEAKMTAIAARLLLTGFVALSQSACGIIGPSCVDLDSVLMTTTAQVDAGASRSFEVVSAQHSNC